jgi:signal transduction histidine kinase
MNKLSKPFIILSLIGVFYSTFGIIIEKSFIVNNFHAFFIGRIILSIAFSSLLISHFLKKVSLEKLSEIFLLTMMIYSIHGQWFIPMYYLAYAEAILLIPLLLPIRLDFLKVSFIIGFIAIISSIILSPASYIEDQIFKQKFIFDSIISVLILSIGTFLSYKYNLKFRQQKDKLFNKFIDIGKNSSFIIHDFKGLTSTPKFYIEYLRKIVESDEYQNENSKNKVLDLVIKLEQEINDIQEYSKEITQLTLPENNLENTKCSLEDIIKSIKVIFRKQLDGIKLTYNPEDSIYYNKNKLKRIISNIILNSIESIKENKISAPKINITIDKNKITLKDNGKGFPKDILKTLNNSNLEFISTKSNGSGLGLSVVKDIINQDNCDIVFSNNNGAQISINLNNIKDKVSK